MKPWRHVRGPGPVLATAIHHGHDLRDEVAALIAMPEDERLREEDPHTGVIARAVPHHLVVQRSRFEVDLNRPREGAVYRTPEEAWGLEVWRDPPPPSEIVEASLRIHDDFYAELEGILTGIEEEHGAFVVLDVHSYNHRRPGAGAPPEDPAGNPEVNVGTGALDRERWGRLVDRFITDLAAQRVGGHAIDIRENVRFRGGYLSRWVAGRFPASGCALAIEFRKSFMDEWTGEVDEAHLAELAAALRATLGELEAELTGGSGS